jgi:hypothetical protein
MQREPIPQLLEEYLARGPETNPWRLATPAGLVLVRAWILLHGLFARGWPVGWLALFLLAELHFVLRLMTLGNRLTGMGPPGAERPAEVTPAQLARAWAWAAIAFVAVFGAGVALARSGAGEMFGASAAPVTAAAALLAYLALEIADFVAAVLAARHGGRRFVSAATISAAFFFIALFLAPIAYFVVQFALAILQRERAVPEAIGTALVLAKASSELAVLYYPVLARRMGLRPRARPPLRPE